MLTIKNSKKPYYLPCSVVSPKLHGANTNKELNKDYVVCWVALTLLGIVVTTAQKQIEQNRTRRNSTLGWAAVGSYIIALSLSHPS